MKKIRCKNNKMTDGDSKTYYRRTALYTSIIGKPVTICHPTGWRTHGSPRRTRRVAPEQSIHQTVVLHLRTRAVPGCTWWHTPNGGRRDPVAGAIFKSLGVRAGVADLVFLHEGQFFALELKAPGGRLTESQAAFLDDVEAAGGIVACAEGLDAALRKLERWGLLRGRMT